MKKSHYRNSRERSYERHKGRKSSSRSRSKEKRKQPVRKSLAKVQSDIKNHFRFKLPNINTQQQQDTIKKLKLKLNECIGPVQHITRSRETMTLNLGFKYDIDALSFLETGGLTITSSSNKIHLQPIPTQAFGNIIRQREQQLAKETNERRPILLKARSRGKNKSPSSSLSSRRKSYSSSRQKKSFMKVQIFGIPAAFTQERVVAAIGQLHGSPRVYKSTWKCIKGSICEYLQIKVDQQKGEKLIDNGKLQIDGRAMIIIEETHRQSKQLLKFQVQIRFPKAVHPSKVLKHIYPYAKVVQIVANQQIQQDGKSKSFIITLNDKGIVSILKKMGQVGSGISINQLHHAQNVYRPMRMLPTRHQL